MHCDALKQVLKENPAGLRELEELEEAYVEITARTHAFLIDAFESSEVADKIDIHTWDEHWEYNSGFREFRNRVKYDLKRLEEILDNFEAPAQTTPSESVLPLSLFAKTRDYLVKVVKQANGCYEHQHYDACAVMIRRLVETLIIEVYKHRGEAEKLKDKDGNFLMLSGLVDRVILDNGVFNLSKNTRKGLPLLADLGNLCAHNPTFNASQSDIDKHLNYLRVIAEELLYIAGLK